MLELYTLFALPLSYSTPSKSPDTTMLQTRFNKINQGEINLKLIGSKTEQEVREQLMVSNKSLFENEERRRLLDVLHRNFPGLETAYILHWIPEQEEDFYKILINDSLIVAIELNRINQYIVPTITFMPISQYKVGLSKINQIKLAVAFDLARKDMNKAK